MEPYQRLEVEVAEWMGLHPDNVVACSSGTAALHLALEALDLPPNSHCICPDFTMVACPRAIKMAGLKPVFVDCNSRLIMSDKELESITTDELDIKAFMAVHIYGRQHVLELPRHMFKGDNVVFIEDMAEMHGIVPDLESDAATWSFYRNKLVAGEEGGVVYLKDKSLAKRARQLRSLGFTDAHDFQHLPRGHNYRMANCLAEKILMSLSQFQRNWKMRREMEAQYRDVCPSDWSMPYRDSPWVFDLRIPGMSRQTQDILVRELLKEGVAARHAFKPMSEQAEFVTERRIGDGSQARAASREVIYLPLVPDQIGGKTCRGVFEVIQQTLQACHPSWVLPSLK